jgi:hypothetical protein
LSALRSPTRDSSEKIRCTHESGSSPNFREAPSSAPKSGPWRFASAERCQLRPVEAVQDAVHHRGQHQAHHGDEGQA